jgi:hypothetical protein
MNFIGFSRECEATFMPYATTDLVKIIVIVVKHCYSF